MGMHYTGGDHSFRPKWITITLENLTQKQASSLIKKYGTNIQQAELEMMRL